MKSIKFKKYDLKNSITDQSTVEDVIFALDKDSPFTFSEWRDEISQPNVTVDLQLLYSEYLSAWADIKKQSNDIKSQLNTREMFTSFLKQLPVDATADELRYIDNIDYNDRYEVETALKFFIQKIKSNIQGISDNRQQVEFQTAKNSVKGSLSGVSLLIKTLIIHLLLDNDFISNKAITPVTKRRIIDELTVQVIELYDMSIHPQSTIEYDPLLHINEDPALQNVLQRYGNVLSTGQEITLTTENDTELDLIFTPDITSLTDLPTGEFADYTPTQDRNKLNIQNVKQIVELSVNTKMQYLSSGSSAATFKIGTLFDSTKNLDRYDSKYNLGINTLEPLQVARSNHIGEYYRPSKLGKIKYYSFSAQQNILYDKIKEDNIYIFPDLTNYGSQRIDLPVDYTENFEFVKNNTLESGTRGEISHEINRFPRFNGYQSHEETSRYSVHGLSRKEDSFDFWSGDIDEVWSNQDVYKLEVSNIFAHDTRQLSRMTNTGQLYDWKPDSYGNEFGLIKKIKPLPGLTIEDFTPQVEPTSCMIIDGSVYKTLSRLDPDITLTINPLDDSFSSYDFSKVANGMRFFDVGCDFNQVIDTNIVIESAELPEGLIYCEFLDGYMATFTGRYENRSTNDDSRFEIDPTIERVWDCSEFNKSCLPAPNTDVHYKLESPEIFDQPDLQFSKTEFQSVESVESLKLEDQVTTPGEMVVRSHDSSQVGKFSDVCDDVLLSLPSDVQESILKNTLNIDTIGDILIIETDKFVIFNHIKTIFDTSSIQPVSNPVIISKHSELSNYIVSDWYYNKEMNHILLCTLNTEDDTLYNTTDQVITKAKLYWIDIDRFELSTTQPTLNWHEDGDTVLSKSFTDLSSAKISYNEVLKKYYVTFLGYLSQDQGDFSFAIGQVMIPNQTTNIGEINIYTSTSPAMFKDASRTLEDRRVVSNVYRQVNPVKSVSTGFNNEVVFENSLSNNLSLDLTLLSSGKTATSVIIDFGDSTANYEKTRLPLIRYDKVDQLVGSDTRNPLDYKVDHTYSNDSPEYICTITVNTMETPTTSDVYTIQVIQKQSDLTTSFNPLETIQSSSAAGIISTNYRQNTPGISINQAKIFVDKFGAENMLLMLKTAHPEFITPVLIKLAQPLRRSKSFDMNNENMLSTDSIDQERITRAMLAQVS